MKIALIGTSPIIVLIAHRLSKNNEVTIFDYSKEFGGAWSWENFNKISVPNKTNVIVPANSQEEKKIKEINKFFLNNFSLKSKKIKNNYHTLHSYKPKNVYEYDLYNMYKIIFAEKRIKIIKKKVSKLEKKNKKLLVNNMYKFDKIFIPFFAGLNTLIYRNKVEKFDYNIIDSKHLFLISKNKLFKDFYYSEDFNFFLDRAQVERKNNLYFFKARIRKEFKKFTKKNLLDLLIPKKKHKKIIKSKIIKYKNFYRNESQLKKIKKINCKNIKVIDTSQFVFSFFKNRINNEK